MKAKAHPNPGSPGQITQILSNMDTPQRKVLLAGLIALFVFAALATLLLGYYIYQPDITTFLQQPTLTSSPTPTPPCVRSTLAIGPYIYPLDVLSPTEQGKIPAIGGPAGTARWLADTFSPFVFIFEPAIGSLDLQAALTPGDLMVVQWADCRQEKYVYTELQPGPPDDKALLAQDSPGIAVIVQPVGITSGFVLRGQRSEPTNPPTAEPTLDSATLADLTFGATTVSEDQQTLTVRLTITNHGSQSITITNDDLSLTALGQTPSRPLEVIPTLTQEIQSGASLSLVITFHDPGGHSATIQVLNFTVDLYY